MSTASTHPALEALLRQPGIWRGDSCSRVTLQSVPTGFAALDACLPGGGWPAGALTELLLEQEGIGELRLILPALAALGTAGHWLAWIAPPHIPYAPALAHAGIALARSLLVHPRHTADELWAAEQALRSGACGAVLAWPRKLEERKLRRLQLAAEAGHALAFLFRGTRAAAQPSPAALRLALQAQGPTLQVQVLKRRGGATGPVILDLQSHAVARTASAGTSPGAPAPGHIPA